MKKVIAIFSMIAVLCSNSMFFAAPVNALEAVTYQEYKEQSNDIQFPDPEETFSEVTENDFVFHVYDEYAFLVDCKNLELTEVVIPDEVDGVPVIGIKETPFGYCRKLTTITLPDSFQYFKWQDLCSTIIVQLGSKEEPFPSVSEVRVSENNPYYTTSEGLLYSKDMKTLIGCPPAIEIKELKLSEETERINDYAFFACYKLEKAIVPSHVKHINNNAFMACLGLVSVELPESIETISGDMFYFCESLSEVSFKGEIKKIGYGAFNNCKNLKEFTIPETVIYIGQNAFENTGCIENSDGVHYVQNWVVGSDENIEKADIKEGTVGISEMAFMVRTNLGLLNIPDSVSYIGDLVFSGLSLGCQTIIHYRCPYINEKTIAPSKTATDIYIYDPECDIFDSEKTIPAEYKYSVESTDILTDDNVFTGNIVIHGYANSTAQAYAEKYDREFKLIEDDNTTPSGDVNGDNVFNIADVVMINKWLLNKTDTELVNWKAADLCKDDNIDVFDMIEMRKILISNDDENVESGISHSQDTE